MRLLIYSNAGAYVGDVATVYALTRVETINGERSITIETSDSLQKQQRILYRDETNKWREYVITGVQEDHATMETPLNTYYAVWSLQYDLSGTVVKTMPGNITPVSSTVALQHALAGTARWSVGTVTQNTTGSASMYYLSGWEALGKVVEVWGGEIDASITVDAAGVVSRAVDLHSQIGTGVPVRRFDYAADAKGITRTVEDAIYTCRIIPRGAAPESDLGGYGRKIDITSVNGGVEYLEDAAIVDAVKVPDGNGGWEYPTQVVEYPEITDPQELYDRALADLHQYTRPRVTYDVEAFQLEAAGAGPLGVEVGDVVDVVDHAFTPAGLRLEGRITAMEIDELNPANTRVTIGFDPEGLPGQFDRLAGQVDAIKTWQDTQTTAEYITGLIDKINKAVNATGGYTYLVPGVGAVTYDVAVSDPAVGAEASQVVEIRGGTIRIANSRDGGGNWEWKTVFTSGHIAGELVTAAQIITGYIGSAGGTFIDLDNDTINLGSTNGALTFLNGLGEVSKNTYGALEVLGTTGVHVGLESGGMAGSNNSTVIDGGSGTDAAAIIVGNPMQYSEGHRVEIDANHFVVQSWDRATLGTSPYNVFMVLSNGQLYHLGGTDMGQTLDLHTTDVNSSATSVDTAFTQDYVCRIRPANNGGNLGIYLNQVGTNDVIHFLLGNGGGRMTYRTSSDGGTTWSAQKGLRSPWVSLGSFTGSAYLNIDLTDYEELMVVAKFSSKLFVGQVTKLALTTSFQEWWLSGGKDNTTSSPANGAGRALVNVRTTRVQGVAANNGSSDVLSSTTFTVYAR